ncbi:glucan endo-1,6-beta-glucosidase [Lentzea aerocolonigenes]|uniref:Glucan endo-1,6-beta-glucosidase n=1 Tax=Lentzea aerocolonigenes TaxID=68170 RepID=A0A0F0HAF1_LENAE|nr:discoidin domain-containing protein [Lentzea aerocolonigenes]KJK50603.1 glucan endo-1,6-beta-glucosidase [Lentzea aerocolonigenes]
MRLTAIVALVLGLTAPAAEASSAPEARVWVTTPDRAELMHERPRVTFGTAASTHPTIVVDPGRSYQTMDGFGASITDSSAEVLTNLSPAVRADTMHKLFDPKQGIGVSFLRQPVGSSDFTAAADHYTYDDVPAGQTDFALQHFSVEHDEQKILPLLREAKRLNPKLKVMATPWSPPAWMKTNDSLVGGQLKDDPKIYDAYARYLVKFVNAYTAAGVPIDFISVQNEPQNRKPDAYPGTDMPVAAQIKVIEALGPKLHRTKILGYDHNWATHPNDGTAEADYPYQVLRSPAAKWLAGTAYHCYYGNPAAQTALHNAFPDKGIWFTECSGSKGAADPPAKVFSDTLRWHARNVVLGTTRNWARSAVNWNIALDGSGGPHNGGCGTCTGLVTVQPNGEVTTDAEYYTIGHLSKFVRPGARRIASTSFGTTGWNGQIMDAAFRNPDGSTALVVHNENDEPRTFAVNAGDRTFEYTLPGGALATFTWTAGLRSKFRAIPLTGATDPALIDDDASTSWSSGAAQAPGQFVQVDLGGRKEFRRVAIDSGGNLGDYVRDWELSASDDGTRWRTLTTGSSTGQLTTIDVRRTGARYLRITSTGTANNWWSIADFRLYK